jgi:hypothetical protein
MASFFRRSLRRPGAAAVLVLFLLLGRGAGLPAQAGAETEVPRSVQLRFYAHGAGVFDDLRLPLNARESVPLELYPGSLSATYAYRGPSRLRLYRERIGPEGVPVPEERGAVELPPGLTKALILVVSPPGAGPGGRLMLFASDDSLEAVPENHLAFLNLTGAELEGRVGETPVRLAAGLSSPVPAEPYFGQRAVLVGLTVRHRDASRIVLENRTRFHAGRRTLIVLLPPEEPGSFEIRAFRIQDLILRREEPAEEPR